MCSRVIWLSSARSRCDVGLIILDWRFAIPNYPSTLLSYLTGHKPVIAATDVNCDTGALAEENGYGFFCPSDSVEAFVATVDKMIASDRVQMGERGYRFFLNNYTTEHTYNAIIRHLASKGSCGILPIGAVE